VLECASARCDRATFAHPALDRLVAEDARCGTDYVHDLQTYLSCGRSATAAARALHVHKNTMYYRIERIENIAKCNLSDERVCLALQIGLEIMQADGLR
jgi:DNA-binding PucR family transcriptional regulator